MNRHGRLGHGAQAEIGKSWPFAGFPQVNDAIAIAREIISVRTEGDGANLGCGP